MRLRLGFGIAALLLLPAGAHAAVVTMCREDTQQVPVGQSGMNLQQAIELGGFITFQCGGPVTIHFKMTHFIRQDTQIDGGGAITLDGGHNRFGMFQGESATARLIVSQLNVVNAGGPPLPAAAGVITIGRLTGEFIGGTFQTVELRAVSVQHSWFPVFLRAGTLRVLASSFANNDGASLSAPTFIEVLDHSRFTNNRGSPIESTGAAVVIEHSDFLGNSEPVRVSGGTLRISHGTFAGNVSNGDGGALRLSANTSIEESEFSNNVAANGGAVFVGGETGSVSIRATQFSNNIAKQAGGAMSFEKSEFKLDVRVSHATFQENRATDGGALSLERAFRSNVFFGGGAVAFVRNQASNDGGAVYAPNAAVQLSRGVFVGNHAGHFGGAIAALQQGDHTIALANSLLVRNAAVAGSAFWGNSASFVNCTIADNDGIAVSAQAVPFGPILSSASTFPIRFVNSIIAGPLPGACGPARSSTPYFDGGHNLQFPGGSCGKGIPSAYPFLGAYYIPFFWSPVLGAGDNTVCDAPPINHKDLYNARRPLGHSHCAVGAVEGDIAHLVKRWLSPERQDGILR